MTIVKQFLYFLFYKCTFSNIKSLSLILINMISDKKENQENQITLQGCLTASGDKANLGLGKLPIPE